MIYKLLSERAYVNAKLFYFYKFVDFANFFTFYLQPSILNQQISL